MTSPLQDILIVDLTHVLAGPFASMICQDLGARVIKVERPDTGDDTRSFPPFKDGDSAYFATINHGKESIALDLKSSTDRETFEALLRHADVVLENYRPGVMERLGYGWDSLHKRFPALIYGAVSGFGHTGPDRLKPAYDMVVQARGGVMSITGEKDRDPVRVGASIGDIIAGMYLCQGLLAALIARQKTGVGQKVDIAMLDSQLAILEHAVAITATTGEAPEPSGARHPSITPFETFHVEDGLVVIAAGNDGLFAKLCNVLELPLADDPRFATNAARCENARLLKRLIEAITLGVKKADMIARLEAAGIPTAEIQSVDQVMQDPQILARNMVVTVNAPDGGSETLAAGNPIKMSDLPDPVERSAPPRLDEHRAQILDWLLDTPAPQQECRGLLWNGASGLSLSKILLMFRQANKIEQVIAMSQDALVIFTPSGKRGRFPVGTPVLTAARQLGVDLDSVCGGRGICSKCQVTPSVGEFPKHGVTVEPDALSDWNAVEQRYKDKRGLIDGRRLGCQATVQSDIVIDVPPESQVHRQVVRKRAEVRDITLNTAVRLQYIEVEEPDMHHPSGDLERIKTALHDQAGIDRVEIDVSLLPSLQPILRKGKWTITVALHKDHDSEVSQIIRVWPGYYEGSIYGLAVDLGSTTIAAHLCDLKTGEVVASSGIMNPQIRFGEDLMSRVSYAMMNEGGDQEMTKAVREGMRALFDQIAGEANIEKDLILDATFVCNPVMHHLFLGIDPYELGQAPFALALNTSLSLKASDLELGLHQGARVYILPCIAGHVGADAAAVALSESPNTSEDLVLLVDVGTNAEIILGDKSRVLACSSPTGPAFEGAQISSGQRAAPGAIERVEIDPVTKEPRFRVIGSEKWSNEEGFDRDIATTGITGICGSGIIEAIAEMRLAGVLDASGLIGSAEQTGSARCIPDGRTNSYLLWDGSADDGPIITVTNPDIRAIQMAKAALYSGARLLMDKFEVDTVDRIVLAGAFGAHISSKHAMVLGMIPDCPLENVTSAGNAAGTGARIALLNIEARTDIEKTVGEIEKIETAVEPRFQEHFVNASAMPNSADPFPILNSIVDLPDVSFNAGGGEEAGGRRRRRRRG